MKSLCFRFLPAVAVAAALVLASCGGGSGTDTQTMTLKDFAYGTKKINLTTYNINYEIDPTGLVDESTRLPEDEPGQSVQVNGTMFGRYRVVFTYTVLSSTEFQITFGWSFDDSSTAIVDGSVASALGVYPDVYDDGEYRANLGGLSSTYSFDQSARTVTLESKWGATQEGLEDPAPTQAGYTVIVK